MRAQVILHMDTPDPEDYVTNSWCFDGTDPATDITGLTTCLKDFYDDLTGAYMSSDLAQNGHEVKFYDLPGPVPNYPVDETTFNLASNPSGSPLPSELAICLSFQGVRTPGFPQRRRRGRVYLGPWGASANTSGRPTAALVTVIANAAATFASNVLALGSDTVWAVWSGADQAAVGIDNGWIDNAWDVQRRRGLEDTSRTTYVT